MGATPRLLRRRPRHLQHRRRAARGADRRRGPSASSRCTCSGSAPTWTPSLAIARRHGLWVVEDAACAFGAWQRGRHAGTLGDVGAFSFHPRKSITTGEGGMVTTDARASWHDAGALAARSRRRPLRPRAPRAAERRSCSPTIDDLGFNYRMTDIQGALGCAQMDRADWILDERAPVARASTTRRSPALDWLRTPVDARRATSTATSPTCCLFAPGGADARRTSTRLHERRNARDGAAGGARHRDPAGHARAGRSPAYYARSTASRRSDFPSAVVAERLSLALPLYPQHDRRRAGARRRGAAGAPSRRPSRVRDRRRARALGRPGRARAAAADERRDRPPRARTARASTPTARSASATAGWRSST